MEVPTFNALGLLAALSKSKAASMTLLLDSISASPANVLESRLNSMWSFIDGMSGLVQSSE